MTESSSARDPHGEPALVFIHGTRMSRAAWTPQLDGLSPAHRCVTVDLPGHGALAGRPYDWDGAIAEIVRVIDTEADGRAVLVGLSLGGYLAMGVAEAYPERVAGLVISGASADPRGALSVAMRALAWIYRHMPEWFLVFADRAFYRLRYSRSLATAIEAGGFAHRAGAEALDALVGRSFSVGLATYPGPTLILNGAFDPPFRLGQRAFGHAARHGRTVVLRRAGHLANLDQPRAFNAALAGFLAEIRAEAGQAPG